MRAVQFAGTRRVTVNTVDDPVILEDTDVIVRITSTALCGMDLHMYDGRTGATPGLPPAGRGGMGIRPANGLTFASRSDR
jgi:glutathione-independent formaldehyde dehydrogenase